MPARTEAGGARPRPLAFGSPPERCAGATPLPRSARPGGFALLAAAVAIAGCRPYVEGNCVYGEESRTVSAGYQGVRVEDGIEATITAGAAQPRLVVSGDSNLLPYIKVDVIGDPGSVPANVLRLRVEMSGGELSACIPPRAVLDAGELTFIGAEGSSHVTATGIATQTLAVAASGKSNVNVDGAGGGRIEVTASDAAVDAATYAVSDGAHVELDAGARAELHSDGVITGTVRAGSTLKNFGTDACAAVAVPAGATPPPVIICPVP